MKLLFTNSSILIMGIIIIISSFFNNVISLPFLTSFENRTSNFALLYFIIISFTILLCQFLMLLSIIKKQTPKIPFKREYHFLKILMFASVASMIFLFSILVIDMYMNNIYDLFIYELIIIYNLVLSIGIVTVLALKFGSWLKKKEMLLYFYMHSHFQPSL
jgi:hypothetical protein